MSQTMREALMSLARREDTNLTWADRVLIGKVIAALSAPSSEQAQQGVDAWRFQWAALIARWDEVEASHLEEVGLGWTKAWLAPKTYALMQEILDSARATTVPNEANHE